MELSGVSLPQVIIHDIFGCSTINHPFWATPFGDTQLGRVAALQDHLSNLLRNKFLLQRPQDLG